MNPDWGEQVRRLVDGARGLIGEAASSEDGAGHGSDCLRCPLCQLVAVVRGERPEVTAALAELLTTAATALRAFAEAPVPAPEPEAGAEEAEDEDGDPPPEVQRIEIA